MIDILVKNFNGILQAFNETNYMLFYSMLVSLVISIPLGVLLFALNKKYLYYNKVLYQILSIILNSIRSIPFLIFIFILIPINRYIFHTSFGLIASVLPLSLVATSTYTRFVEQALLNVKSNIVDRAISMGATKMQIIIYFLIPSSLKDLILSFTSIVISILAYSTVMGVIGAGGLGEYAFRYGYQEYDYQLMYLIIIIFIIYVFIIQTIGYLIANIIRRES